MRHILELSDCGTQELKATNAKQSVTISNYYGTGRCIYRIKAFSGRIRLNVDSHSFTCKDTCEDYVEVKYLEDKSTTGKNSILTL